VLQELGKRRKAPWQGGSNLSRLYNAHDGASGFEGCDAGGSCLQGHADDVLVSLG
jgi:hypothetical protein